MKKIIGFLLFICCVYTLNAQSLPVKKESRFTLKGTVLLDNKKPLEDFEILVNGSPYTTTNQYGEFRISVKKGDKVEIKNEDFDVFTYTVKEDDNLIINAQNSNYSNSFYINEKSISSFEKLLDSAKYYGSFSLEKSTNFIEASIKKSTSVKQNAEAFETLADIYLSWKQYDLAITNYRISLNSNNLNAVNLKLAKAYELNQQFSKSLDIYKKLEVETLNNYQNIELQEGLADVYFKTSEIKKALNTYKLALADAEKLNVTHKITNLNSKIGAVYAKMGANKTAQDYYKKSLKLAGEENKLREVEEAVKVADFQNTIQNFDNEIATRKKVLSDVESTSLMPKFSNESNLTPQKQNYKIGNALYMQKNYNEAVPYLEKSIKQADEKEDLVVKKDATKKLSEVFSASKKYNKALETYKEYTSLVEALYQKKEQEISQAARFSKRLSEKQNRIESLETDRQLTISRISLTNERSKRQQFYIYALIVGLLLLILLAFLMYKYIKQQRLANNLLALKSLRSQMNPHFIFNALNSVNSFIAVNDERTANKYLSDFSKLMRAVLENSEEDFIPLEKEIELIELYTKLEHFRFQDKFEYHINIDESVTVSNYQIPPMLLQPYIENAVWHGLRYREEKGCLDITITKHTNQSIKIIITDNGIGRAQSKALKTNHQKKHNSKGLGNIAKRVAILNDMYKDKIDVNVTDNPNEQGTQVTIILKK